MEQNNNFGKKVIRILGKGILLIGKGFIVLIFLLALIQVKKCMRNSVKDSYEKTESYNSTKDADSELKRFAKEENETLPHAINENVTTQAILIEKNALVYVYNIDDDFWAEFKVHAVSRSNQLNNLRSLYLDMKPMIDLLIKTHRGIYYRYICRGSGEVTEVKIYYSDLLDLK